MTAKIIQFPSAELTSQQVAEKSARFEFRHSCFLALTWQIERKFLPLIRGPHATEVKGEFFNAFILGCTGKEDDEHLTVREWKKVLQAAGLEAPPIVCSELARQRWDLRQVHPEWPQAKIDAEAKESMALLRKARRAIAKALRKQAEP